MHTKTMEGLVGASTNMKQLNTPMRVFKEARRKGDSAKMDRAMDYVSDFSGKIDEYQKKAEEGIKEEAEELKEKEKTEREKAIEKRREERTQERIEENNGVKEDTVQISEEGKLLLKNTAAPDERKPSQEAAVDTETGEVSQERQGGSISISV